MVHIGELGRRVPTDTKHLDKYKYKMVEPRTIDRVERTLKLPYQYRPRYDQGQEGACVGFAASWSQSILNRQFYDARWLYIQAQLVDEWHDTPPEEGTSVRAAYDILRDVGHKRLSGIYKPKGPELIHGISANRWAFSVDELRTAIATGNPVTIGVNWYQDFDRPVDFGGLYNTWIGRDPKNLGRIRGGHAVCLYGASDKRQAFRMINNWGMEYPLVWIPYATMQRLLDEWGEAAIATDR